LDLSDRGRALSLARALAGALALAPFLILGLLYLAGPRQGTRALVVPAGVLGLAAPAVGWRLQARIRERAPGGGEAGRRAYVGAVVSGLSVTAGASLLGVVAWFLSGDTLPLLGLVMHLLLAMALWPTDERLEQAEEGP
jgi:hypothetical protein